MSARVSSYAASLVVLLASLVLAAPPQSPQPTKPAVLDMGSGCRVVLQVPTKAEFGSAAPEPGIPGRGGLSVENPLALKRNTYIEPFGLRFTCYDANDGVVNRGWAKQEPDGTWSASVLPSDEQIYRGAVHSHQLRAASVSGWAVTVDEVVGDERYRTRKLYYCLIHPPKAICGDSEMGNLNDIRRNRKNDLTPYALQILRSVEFLNDGTAPPAERAASEPAPR